MKSILYIIAVLIILGSIGRFYQKRKGREAYKRYLASLDKLNVICSKFGVPHQVEGQSFGKVEADLKEKHSEITSMLDADKLTNFRDKRELNEAYHDALRLTEKSERLFVTWENVVM